MTARVALVTCAEFPQLGEDEPLLLDALRQRGVGAEPAIWDDPHEDVRDTKAARTQKSDFLAPNGSVVDVCGGQPCHTDAYTP